MPRNSENPTFWILFTPAWILDNTSLKKTRLETNFPPVDLKPLLEGC
jgi:hypothetical protein